MKNKLRLVTLCVLLVLLSGCAYVAAPSIALPMAPAIPALPMAVPQVAVLVGIIAVNGSSGPPISPCDLAYIAFQILDKSKWVFHDKISWISINGSGYEFSIITGNLNAEISLGQDSFGVEQTMAIRQLVQWIQGCPSKYEVTWEPGSVKWKMK